MAKVRISGSTRAPLKVELDKRLAAVAEVTVKERRRLIVGELEHMGLTAFDLLSWEGMLALLDATKNAEPFGMTGPYQVEIHRHVAIAARRRANELDATFKEQAGADYHLKMLKQFL